MSSDGQEQACANGKTRKMEHLIIREVLVPWVMYPCTHVSSEDSLLFERKSLERLRRRQRMSRWAHRPTELYRLSLPCLFFKTFSCHHSMVHAHLHAVSESVSPKRGAGHVVGLWEARVWNDRRLRLKLGQGKLIKSNADHAN